MLNELSNSGLLQIEWDDIPGSRGCVFSRRSRQPFSSLILLYQVTDTGHPFTFTSLATFLLNSAVTLLFMEVLRLRELMVQCENDEVEVLLPL